MQYIEGLKEYTDTGKSAVTFGKFDGLHRGPVSYTHLTLPTIA